MDPHIIQAVSYEGITNDYTFLDPSGCVVRPHDRTHDNIQDWLDALKEEERKDSA